MAEVAASSGLDCLAGAARSCYAGFVGEDDHLDPVAQAELGHDADYVTFHCGVAEVQSFGDLASCRTGWCRSGPGPVPAQQDRHQGRRTVLLPGRLTQNPAGFTRQWMHSWMVCGSRAGKTLVRCLSRGGCGRAPTRSPAAAIVRAGAGSGECVVEAGGSGRAEAAITGTAAWRASGTPARLVRWARVRPMRGTLFMMTSYGKSRGLRGAAVVFCAPGGRGRAAVPGHASGGDGQRLDAEPGRVVVWTAPGRAWPGAVWCVARS